VVELRQLGRVLTVVEAVGYGCEGEFLLVIFGLVGDGEVRRPSVVDDTYSPQSILGIAPPSKDDFAVERYLAACGVEEDLAAGVNQD